MDFVCGEGYFYKSKCISTNKNKAIKFEQYSKENILISNYYFWKMVPIFLDKRLGN